MRVMITGAMGFIGSHLSNHYLDHGHTVVGVDDFSTSLGVDSPHAQNLSGRKNFEFCECDITNSSFTQTFVKEKFDLILNFACPASPPKYQDMPLHTLRTSTVGVDHVLTLAQRCGARVVHASTSEVYGDPQISPQHEAYWGNVNSFGARSMYDEGKRAAESLVWIYKTHYNVDIRMARIFNTYGPHMDPDDGRVVTNFIKQALTNKPMTLYGDGSQSRSFCYVTDLVRGIVKLAEVESCPDSPINLGNPSEMTVADLATAVFKLLPESTSKIMFKDLPYDDPCRRCPDIFRAKRILGWSPKVSLEEGLKKMIDYMVTVQCFFDR
jgi:nucleoside-diphosphate-sugar epimerase